METAADVANPVQRKEKKGLDFSRWREIVEKDAKPAYHEKEKGGHSNGMEVGQKDKKMASNGLRRPIADRDGAKLQSVTMGDNASKIEEVKEETRDKYCNRQDDGGWLKARGVGVFDLESGIIGPIDSHTGYSKMFWPPPDWVYSTASIEDGLNQMNI